MAGCASCLAGAFAAPRVRSVRRGFVVQRVPIKAHRCACDACQTTGVCPMPEKNAGAVIDPATRRVHALERAAGASQASGKPRVIDYINSYTQALARASRDAGDAYDPFADENNDGTNDISDLSLAEARLRTERQRALAAATTPAERAAQNRRFDGLERGQKEAILRAAAREAGADDAATSRLIATGITRGLEAFNAALAGSYGVEVARINADRDIQIARITGRSAASDELLVGLRTAAVQPLTVQSSTAETGLLLLGVGGLAYVLAKGKK